MPLLQALTDKMRWHQARQTVLAENIANAQTPNYTARDLKAFSLDGPAKGGLSMASVSFSANSPNHIAISSLGRTDGFAREETEGFEMGPGGNSVDLEDEMMKVAGNELDYQTATTLYTRSLRLIRTALGRTA
ncbi:MAG: flagellar basal body rod protein FlgB [Devosia sp.]